MSGRILAPYTKPPAPNTVALATSPSHMLTEDGSRRRLLGRDGLTIYARPTDIDRWWQAGHGWRYMKESRLIYWEHSGVLVRPLPDDSPVTNTRALSDLVTWASWLRSHGASPSSMGQSAMSLYKATATHPKLIPHRGKGGASGPGLYVLGGRIGDRVGRGSYEGPILQYDVQAAYARQLSRISYGRAWVEIKEPALKHLPTVWAEGIGIFAHARVRTPADLGPLPRRPRRELSVWDHMWRSVREEVYPRGTVLRGVWCYDELIHAEEAGALVKIDRAWLMPAEDGPGPFSRWWDVVQEGRTLPGFAGTLAKVTGNCMWGQLIVRPGKVTRKRIAGRRLVSEDVRDTRYVPRYVHIAELVTGRTRADMDWALRRVGSAAMSWHTDGIWCFAGRGYSPSLPAPWRVKKTATALDYIYPDTFAWSDGTRTHYSMAGITRADQETEFDQLWVTLCPDVPRRTGTGNLTRRPS